MNLIENFYLSATSLCEGETIEKKVGVLSVRGKEFKLDAHKLQTVRPLIFKTISLLEEGPDTSRYEEESEIQAIIDQFLKDYIEKLLEDDLPPLLTGHPRQPKMPLVRVRVEYVNDKHILSVGRFGNHFMDRIANHSDILLFKRMTHVKKDLTAGSVDFSKAQMDDLMQRKHVFIIHLYSVEKTITYPHLKNIP